MIRDATVPFETPHEFGFVQQNRRGLLFEHVDVHRGKGLEIGPYAQPTVTKDEADIEYLDVQTREALIAALDDPALARRIPFVDHVCSSTDYTESTRGPFDYIVANHVFEHVANPIRWLQTIASMLVPDGVLFLSLPDKKFTFDKFRPDTPLSHIVYDYFTGTERTSMEHVLESEMYYDRTFVGAEMKIAERLDPARLRAAFDIPMHPGWHCHVFRSETFVKKILEPLQLMGLIEFELQALRPARAETGGEFHVVLRRRKVRPTLTTEEFFTVDVPIEQPVIGKVSVPEVVPRLVLERWIPRGSRLRRVLFRIRCALFGRPSG